MALVYATSFPLLRESSMETVIGELRTWISGNQHRGISFSELEGLSSGDLYYEKGKVKIETANYQRDKLSLFGLNLTEANGALRQTRIVARKTPAAFDVSVTHDIATTTLGDGIGQTNKPRIVNDLIEKVGGGYDGMALQVSLHPEQLKKDDAQFASEILLNKTNNTLPIVYISCSRGKPLLNAEALSQQLSGIAHVLIEPSIPFSYELSKLTNRKNVYGGAIGVYWPNGERKSIHSITDSAELEQRILKHIHERSLYQDMPSELTFDGIKTLQMHDAIERLKLEKATSVEDALNIAIQEGERYERQIKELKGKLAFYESQPFKQQKAKGSLIQSVDTPELYADETYDLIVSAIKHYSNNVHPESRKLDMLNSLLEKNQPTGERDVIIEELNRIFKSATHKFTAEMQRDLERLGFTVTHQGPHYILTVPGQGRKHTIPATPGDHRSFKNCLSEIKNTLL